MVRMSHYDHQSLCLLLEISKNKVTKTNELPCSSLNIRGRGEE
jgi:hypothetical protein